MKIIRDDVLITMDKLHQRYILLIQKYSLPYANSVKDNHTWMMYVRFCMDINCMVNNKKDAFIVDWGGLWGHNTCILRALGFDRATNYLLYEEEAYRYIKNEMEIPTIIGKNPNKLNLIDGSVDALISSGVLEHVTEDGIGNEDEVLRDIFMKLKQGGHFFIWALPRRYGLSEVLSQTFRGYSHKRRYFKAEIYSVLQDAGFEIIKFGYHFTIPGRMQTYMCKLLPVKMVYMIDVFLSKTIPFKFFANNFYIYCEKPVTDK
jgi:hypothetical protein